MATGTTSGARQTRRRGQALEQAILDAAWAELRERGWRGFTIEAVADRSGAAKSVIYRRWRNRVELAQEMLQRRTMTSPEPFPSSGDLRADLLEFLRGMAEFLRSPFGDAARGIAHEGDPATQRSLFGDEGVISLVVDIVEQARGRGQLDGRPTALALNLGHGLVVAEFLQAHQPPPDAGLVELVDTIWLPALRRCATEGAGPHDGVPTPS